MVALGFLAGLWTASRRSFRDGIAGEKIIDLGPWLIVGSILGARAFYVVSYWREAFAGGPIWEIFMIWQGGLVFYGGLIGASLACIFYARLKKLPMWKLGDVFAPSIALGHAFGRIGCLLNGCCYGRACSLPWAITFTNPQAHELSGTPLNLPLHPTEIYESLLNLGLYFALAQLYRRKKFDGQIFATYLVCYGVIRFFVELFRGDYPHKYFGWVTPAQPVSFAIFIIGLVLVWKLPRQPRTPSARSDF